MQMRYNRILDRVGRLLSLDSTRCSGVRFPSSRDCGGASVNLAKRSKNSRCCWVKSGIGCSLTVVLEHIRRDD